MKMFSFLKDKGDWPKEISPQREDRDRSLVAGYSGAGEEREANCQTLLPCFSDPIQRITVGKKTRVCHTKGLNSESE